MRISDWSSVVCSSDPVGLDAHEMAIAEEFVAAADRQLVAQQRLGRHDDQRLAEIAQHLPTQDVELLGRRRENRKSVGEGKSVSVRVDFGGPRTIKKKTN